MESVFGLDVAHWHLLTNHAPIFVVFSGLSALGLGIVWKNEVAKRVALILLLIGTIGGLVTYWFGQQAYKPMRGMADEAGQDWLDLHMERAEKIVWLFWATAAVTGFSLVAVWKHVKHARLLTFVAGAFAAALLGVSGWIADAGGKIRHPEIRGAATAPTAEGADDKHEH